MILENKLNITDQAELAREEERISKWYYWIYKTTSYLKI